MKNGTIKLGKNIDWTGDHFGRTVDTAPDKHFVFFGMWKGPFDSAAIAKEAYREWAWESKHS